MGTKYIDGDLIVNGYIQRKYYNFVLQDGQCSLQLNIPYEKMQDIYDSINNAMSTNISTPQGIINLYDQMKDDNLSQQVYLALVQLFGGISLFTLLFNCNNAWGDLDGVSKITATGSMNGPLAYGNTEIFNIDQSAVNKIHFSSTSTLLIYLRNSDELD